MLDCPPRVVERELVAADQAVLELLRACVAAAVRAPSGDNLQPWRFDVDALNGEIAVCLDASRDRSPMNAGQKMSRIACGAAVQNILIAADAAGGSATLLDVHANDVVARILVRPGNGSVRMPRAIVERATHRGMYSGEPPSESVHAALVDATPRLDGVDTNWICEPERKTALSKSIGAADALMFANAAMRTAFFASVRFDRPARESVDHGLSLASLELSAPERLSLPLMKQTPTALLRLGGVFRGMSAHSQKLVVSASGLCVITAKNASDRSCVTVGRALQQAWLELTRRGFVAQPMMSLLVLANALENGASHMLDRAQTEQLLQAFRAELNLDAQPMFLLRFGYAGPHSGRTGRRPTPEISAP